MYYLAIIMGLVFYYLYKKGYLKLKPDRKSEDTKRHVLKMAEKKYESGEMSKEEYDKIKNDLNNS